MGIATIPTKNALQTTLASSLSAGETGSLSVSDDLSSFLSDASTSRPFWIAVDRIDANGTKTPTTREYIKVTGVSGTTWSGLTRGEGGSTGQAHSAGAIVELVVDADTIKSITDTFLVQHASDGTHSFSGTVTVAGTDTDSAGIRLAEDTDNGTNYMGLKAPSAVTTSTDLVLPNGDGSANQVLKTDGSGNLGWVDQTTLTKAAGSDVTTGTDDAKYVTSKALADANVKSTGRLVWSAQTALSPTFVHSASTGEEEVTGLRTSLPVLTGTYTIIATFIGYMSVGTANNVLRIRAGTSTTYLSNAEKAQIYIGNAKTQETATCKAIFTADLSTQTYVVIGASADASASSFSLSSSGNRTSVCIEVYSP